MLLGCCADGARGEWLWQQVSAARLLVATARRHEFVPSAEPSVECSRLEPDLHGSAGGGSGPPHDVATSSPHPHRIEEGKRMDSLTTGYIVAAVVIVAALAALWFNRSSA